MHRAYLQRYLAIEETQWWCKARRETVRRLVKDIAADRTTKILEIGCSGGILLQELKRDGYSAVAGIDISEAAIRAARDRGLSDVSVMDAAHLNWPDASFDLLIASDVLEHIAEPVDALREWRRVLAARGKLIVFVPAFQFLWSAHDEANQHHRRYSAPELSACLKSAGFQVERLSYWNALLTIPGVLLKVAERLLRRSARSKDAGGLVQPARAINQLLYRTITAENLILNHADLPFGTSAFAVARR